jgi:hypothetical protein
VDRLLDGLAALAGVRGGSSVSVSRSGRAG